MTIITSSSIPGIGSNFPALFDSIMSAAAAQDQKPIAELTSQKSDLTTTLSMYKDFTTGLTDLKTLVDSLKTGATSVFGQNRSSINNGDSLSGNIIQATASPTASVGNYTVSVTTLAKAQQVRSDKQGFGDQPLGLTGAFVLGGGATSAIANAQPSATTVTGFNTAAIRSGQGEHGSGKYYVETRQNPTTSAWQFRMVDETGKSVSIGQLSDATRTQMTSDWQTMPDAGATVDTGRGLTFTIDPSGAWQTGSKGNGAANITYTAKGATVTVAAGDSLQDIANNINKGSFAVGNELSATVVNGNLVLAAANTGTLHTLSAADATGTVLQSLGVLTAGGVFKNTLQDAFDASFKVNNISVTRQTNTGLSDVINGVSLDLLAEGRSATLSVQADTGGAQNKIQAMLTKFNAIQSYLKTQAGTTANASGGGFTRGRLAGDSVFSRLRTSLFSDLSAAVVGMAGGAPNQLSAIGITLDPTTLNASISDSGKLSAALSNNYQNVAELFDKVATRMSNEMAPLLSTDTGVLASRTRAANDRIKSIDLHVTALNAAASRHQAQLQVQYSNLMQQMSLMSQQASNMNALLGATVNITG